jgi:hypothetical protein
MLEHNGMIVQELFYDEQDDGILGISIVKDPAIEKLFTQFAVEPRYFYTLRPEYGGAPMVLNTSHNLCKKYAKGDRVAYSAKTIKGMTRYIKYGDKWGFTPEASLYFNNFPHVGTDLGNCMYGCRHHFKKKDDFHRNMSFQFEFEKVEKPRRIKGPVMIGNKPIFRPPEDLDGVHWGYVYFSNETVEKLQKNFGINSTATFLHSTNISKYMIMTKSWLVKDNPLHWEWWAEYHILNDFIWEQIIDGEVQGFSVEVAVSRK